MEIKVNEHVTIINNDHRYTVGVSHAVNSGGRPGPTAEITITDREGELRDRCPIFAGETYAMEVAKDGIIVLTMGAGQIMDLKYFTIERTENGYGVIGEVLMGRVFSITKEGGNVIFREECDGYFYETFTKKQAIELLNEAIEYIEENF